MYKFIIIKDLGRNLNPIGYNLKSPILKPAKFSLDIIRRLLCESHVTAMYEVFEKDHSFMVKLNTTNYKEDFITLWEKENPGKIFPWTNTVVEVKNQINDNLPIEDDNDKLDNSDKNIAAPEDIKKDPNLNQNEIVEDTIDNIDEEPDLNQDKIMNTDKPEEFIGENDSLSQSDTNLSVDSSSNKTLIDKVDLISENNIDDTEDVILDQIMNNDSDINDEDIVHDEESNDAAFPLEQDQDENIGLEQNIEEAQTDTKTEETIDKPVAKKSPTRSPKNRRHH